MITIKAVGDICPGDMSIPGMGLASLSIRRGVSDVFRMVTAQLKDCDLLIGNLEGMLSERLNRASLRDLRFCGIPEFATELKERGFSVVSVANNHVLENGSEIFLETVELLGGAGIEVCGLRGDGEFYSKPVVISRNGYRVGILAYNWIGVDRFEEADRFIAQARDGIVNYTWERDKGSPQLSAGQVDRRNIHVHEDIRRLRPHVDILILCPHWGYEFSHVPPLGVVREARSFVSAGADLILGGHPHVLQGMERFGEGMIFYSLGNFVFDMPLPMSRFGAVLEASFQDGRWEHDFSFTSLDRLNRPRPAEESDQERLRKVIEGSSAEIHMAESSDALLDDRVYQDYERVYFREKLLKIPRLFHASLRHPSVVLVIARKIRSFLGWAWNRIRGKRVRW